MQSYIHTCMYASLYCPALFYLCRNDADQAEALLIRSLHKHKGGATHPSMMMVMVMVMVMIVVVSIDDDNNDDGDDSDDSDDDEGGGRIEGS